MKILRAVTLLALVAFCFGILAPDAAFGQAATFPATPVTTLPFGPWTSTSTSYYIDMSKIPNQDVHYWTLTWYALTSFGTIPTCQIKVQKATSSAGAGVADLIADQTCTSTGETTTATAADTNFVRVNLDTKSGTGQIWGVLAGYRQNPYGTLNVAVVSGSTGNAASSATGSAVPAQAGYTGVNVSGTLRGVTATNVSGAIYAMDVNIAGGGGSGGTASNFGSAVPATGTAAGFSDGTNMQNPRVFDADSGAGTQYVTGVNLRAIGNGGSTEIGIAAAPLRVDPTGTTSQPVVGAAADGAAVAGNPVRMAGKDGSGNTQDLITDTTGNLTIIGAGTAGTANAGVMTVQGIASMTPILATLSGTNNINTVTTVTTVSNVTPIGATTDAKNTATDGTAVSLISIEKEISAQIQALGAAVIPVASRCTLVSAASTNATNCKGSAGNILGFRLVNTTTTVYYLRMYNLASSPTCSSATGFIESIPIPPAGASGQAGGIVAMEPFEEAYSTGIGFCFTAGATSTDNSNAATGVYGSILYN